jgi:hypothetical protein
LFRFILLKEAISQYKRPRQVPQRAEKAAGPNPDMEPHVSEETKGIFISPERVQRAGPRRIEAPGCREALRKRAVLLASLKGTYVVRDYARWNAAAR